MPSEDENNNGSKGREENKEIAGSGSESKSNERDWERQISVFVWMTGLDNTEKNETSDGKYGSRE